MHLRCGYFFTNLLMDVDSLRAGSLAIMRPPDVPMPWVDPRDVGDIVAARLLSTAWSGREVQAVHGPEDLSYTDVADILTRATGREITLKPVSDDDVRQGMLNAGMSARAADGIMGMTSGTRDGFRPEQSRSIFTTTPTRLGEWAFTHLRPVLSA